MKNLICDSCSKKIETEIAAQACKICKQFSHRSCLSKDEAICEWCYCYGN